MNKEELSLKELKKKRRELQAVTRIYPLFHDLDDSDSLDEWASLIDSLEEVSKQILKLEKKK